jgi:Uma2 family endonuclease
MYFQIEIKYIAEELGGKLMALAQKHPVFTVDKYLGFERFSPERHEFIDGSVYAMAGESVNHSKICYNLNGITHAELRGKRCNGFSPNMKIATSDTGLFSYPDLAIVCGSPAFFDDSKDVITNPTVIFEVLSPSTEHYDRGEKFLRYSNYIETLQDYILVSQDEPLVEHYRKQKNAGWKKSVLNEFDAVIEIESIDCQIKLSDLYELVEFSA